MSTTCHRLRSYSSPSDRAVPVAQADQDSSSCSKRCSHRRLRCAANDDCHVDFGHTFAVVDTHSAAGLVLADRKRSAIHSSSGAVLAAALAVAAVVAAGLVSLVHRSRV